MKHKRSQALTKLAIAFAFVLVATLLYVKVQPYTYEAKTRAKLESTMHSLQVTREALQEQQAITEQSKEAQAKQIEQLNKLIQEKDKQLQAKASAKVAYAATLPKPAPTVKGVTNGVTNCGDNIYKQFIYQHESGCRTNARNPNGGACGLGQALPCSKMPCSLSDWVCQDKFFSNYAIQRYGSWANAYAFWKQHSWW